MKCKDFLGNQGIHLEGIIVHLTRADFFCIHQPEKQQIEWEWNEAVCGVLHFEVGSAGDNHGVGLFETFPSQFQKPLSVRSDKMVDKAALLETA